MMFITVLCMKGNVPSTNRQIPRKLNNNINYKCRSKEINNLKTETANWSTGINFLGTILYIFKFITTLSHVHICGTSSNCFIQQEQYYSLSKFTLNRNITGKISTINRMNSSNSIYSITICFYTLVGVTDKHQLNAILISVSKESQKYYSKT